MRECHVLAWVRNFFPKYTLTKIGSAGRVSLLTGKGFLRINRAFGRKNGIWEETKTEKGGERLPSSSSLSFPGDQLHFTSLEPEGLFTDYQIRGSLIPWMA